MAGYIQKIDDRHQIVAWLKSGVSEKGYTARIRPILEKTCLKCHSPASGLKIPDFTSYKGIRAVANVDTGESLHTLMKLSHIKVQIRRPGIQGVVEAQFTHQHFKEP